MRNLKIYIKRLSSLFANQFRQSLVWTMELAINAVWYRLTGPICGLDRPFDDALPGPRAGLFAGSGPMRRPPRFPE